jgi:hypothetical protein
MAAIEVTDMRRLIPGAGRAGNGADEPSLSAWIAERPSRGTPIDYGARWIDSERPDRYWRLSWAPGTGQLYLSDPAESDVRVLAVIADEAQVEIVLAGWTAIGSRPRPPLSWVEERVGRWHSAQDT